MRCNALHQKGSGGGHARRGIVEILDLSQTGSRLCSYHGQILIPQVVEEDNLRWAEELLEHNVHSAEDFRHQKIFTGFVNGTFALVITLGRR